MCGLTARRMGKGGSRGYLGSKEAAERVEWGAAGDPAAEEVVDGHVGGGGGGGPEEGVYAAMATRPVLVGEEQNGGPIGNF